MDVWYAIPSANPTRCSVAFQKWRAQGYKCAVVLDPTSSAVPEADLTLRPKPYPGYFRSVNALAKAIGSSASIVVTGGDDMTPDPTFTAQQLAEQFYERFPDGYGVMQPTGDDLPGTEKICGSPWFGRAWLDESYEGNGPMWHEYRSFSGDEELRFVAEAQGVLWQRRDLVQRHDHWTRRGLAAMTNYQRRNEALYFERDAALFRERQDLGFPGSARKRSA